jgi:isoamylase
VRRDPVLSQVKLIAEPWDLGPEGYQLGRFPAGWSEWNGKYRDSVRQFWRGDPGQVDHLASRLSGSGDIYGTGGRTPQASVNFVTCHDGFTLQDLVSYETKHNLTNGEHNRDGTDYNLSRNWGVEGPTEAVRTAHIRERMKRNFLATLAFSQGVPMLLHGDEMGRSQLGNNNAYCHDSPLTWISWDLTPEQRDLLQFTRDILALRAATPALRRSRFLSSGGNSDSRELTWVGADGHEVSAEAWRDPANHVVGMLIRAESDGVVLLLLNAGGRSRPFTLPALGIAGAWRVLVDTHHPGPRMLGEASVNLRARSLLLLWYQPV